MSDHAPPHRSGPTDAAEQPAENLALSEPGAWIQTPLTFARSVFEFMLTYLLYVAAGAGAIYAVERGLPLWPTLLIALGVCAVLGVFRIQRERKRRGQRRGQGFNPFS